MLPSMLARQRSGWALRTNRCLAGGGAWRSARKFASAFHHLNEPPLAPSQITRWESGQRIPDRVAVRRYEDLLQLAPLMLTSAIDATLRFGIAKRVATKSHRRFSIAQPDSLHELLRRIELNGRMDSRDWYALGVEVELRPKLVLFPPNLWEMAAQNLLCELVTATEASWLTRQEGLSILIEHPDARHHVIDACIQMIADDANPGVLEPFSLLDVVDDQRSNDYVLGQLRSPTSPHALAGALLAGTSKLQKGHFRGSKLQADLPAAAIEVIQFAEINPTLQNLAIDFCSSLARKHFIGSPASHEFLRTFGSYRESSEWHSLMRRNGRKLCYAVAQAAHDAHTLDEGGTDSVLFGLIEDMLLHINPDARLYAAMLVAATPYRDPLGSSLAAEIRARLSELDESIIAAGLRVLTILRVTAHRPIILRLLTSQNTPEGLRRAAAAAVPHGAGKLREQDWRQIIAVQLDKYRARPSTVNEDVLFHVIYGISTDGHVALTREAAEDLRIPARVRNAARWWRISLHQPVS